LRMSASSFSANRWRLSPTPIRRRVGFIRRLVGRRRVHRTDPRLLPPRGDQAEDRHLAENRRFAPRWRLATMTLSSPRMHAAISRR
jgi:hypothetical protein